MSITLVHFDSLRGSTYLRKSHENSIDKNQQHYFSKILLTKFAKSCVSS